MTAGLIGLLAGFGIAATLYRARMLHERSSLAVLIAAIAFFYPVFAVQADAGLAGVVLHSVVFVGFCGLALYGFSRSTRILAAALIAHGLFDGLTAITGHPGPIWWPAFCGMLDIAAGVSVLALIAARKVPQ